MPEELVQIFRDLSKPLQGGLLRHLQAEAVLESGLLHQADCRADKFLVVCLIGGNVHRHHEGPAKGVLEAYAVRHRRAQNTGGQVPVDPRLPGQLDHQRGRQRRAPELPAQQSLRTADPALFVHLRLVKYGNTPGLQVPVKLFRHHLSHRADIVRPLQELISQSGQLALLRKHPQKVLQINPDALLLHVLGEPHKRRVNRRARRHNHRLYQRPVDGAGGGVSAERRRGRPGHRGGHHRHKTADHRRVPDEQRDHGHQEKRQKEDRI